MADARLYPSNIFRSWCRHFENLWDTDDFPTATYSVLIAQNLRDQDVREKLADASTIVNLNWEMFAGGRGANPSEFVIYIYVDKDVDFHDDIGFTVQNAIIEIMETTVQLVDSGQMGIKLYDFGNDEEDLQQPIFCVLSEITKQEIETEDTFITYAMRFEVYSDRPALLEV